MKIIFYSLVFAFFCCAYLSVNSHALGRNAAYDKCFVVIITSYDNSQWYKRNLSSVYSQKYDNYRVIYIDDCSTDGTADLVLDYIQKSDQEHRTILIKNNVWQSQMANHYNAIYMCDDDEIVVHLDGDDWLADNQVLSFLNTIYSNQDVWLTYGQFKTWPANKKGHCAAISDDIIGTNSFRDTPWLYSHLRTFYAGLFKQIKLQDLLMMGTFKIMSPTPDLAFMYPMLEMAGSHIKFISKILYVYNKKNSLSQQCISQQILEKEICTWWRYTPIADFKTSKKEKTPAKIALNVDLQSGPEGLDLLLNSLKIYAPEIIYSYTLDAQYILHITDSVVLTEKINWAECIDYLEKTDAYAFNFLVDEKALKSDDVCHCYCVLSDIIGAWQHDFVDCVWQEPVDVRELKPWLEQHCKPSGITLEKRDLCLKNQMVLYRVNDFVSNESNRKLTLFYITAKAKLAINQ